MTLQPCAECGSQISDMATACPKCGKPESKIENPKPWVWIPLVLLAAFALYVMMAGSDPSTQQQRKDSRAIDACRQVATDFLLCEEMVADYRRKYGSNP